MWKIVSSTDLLFTVFTSLACQSYSRALGGRLIWKLSLVGATWRTRLLLVDVGHLDSSCAKKGRISCCSWRSPYWRLWDEASRNHLQRVVVERILSVVGGGVAQNGVVVLISRDPVASQSNKWIGPLMWLDQFLIYSVPLVLFTNHSCHKHTNLWKYMIEDKLSWGK